MMKWLDKWVGKRLRREKGNLVALDDPYAVIRRLMQSQKVEHILDAGASNGRVSSRLLGLFPDARVYAFEPNPAYAAVLRKRNEEDERIQPQFYALSDSIGNITLNVTQSPGITSVFKASDKLRQDYPEESEITQSVEVECLTIDEWRRQNGNVPLHIMKLDIQGGELNALKGAVESLKSTKLIYSEVLFNQLYEGGAVYSEIDLFLREQGFYLYNFYKTRNDKDDCLQQANAVYLKQV